MLNQEDLHKIQKALPALKQEVYEEDKIINMVADMTDVLLNITSNDMNFYLQNEKTLRPIYDAINSLIEYYKSRETLTDAEWRRSSPDVNLINTHLTMLREHMPSLFNLYEVQLQQLLGKSTTEANSTIGSEANLPTLDSTVHATNNNQQSPPQKSPVPPTSAKHNVPASRFGSAISLFFSESTQVSEKEKPTKNVLKRFTNFWRSSPKQKKPKHSEEVERILYLENFRVLDQADINRITGRRIHRIIVPPISSALKGDERTKEIEKRKIYFNQLLEKNIKITVFDRRKKGDITWEKWWEMNKKMFSNAKFFDYSKKEVLVEKAKPVTTVTKKIK